MSQNDKKDLWCYRKAAPSLWTKKIIMASLVVAGILSILNLFDWWFREEHIASLFLFSILSFIFWWDMLRRIILWISYLKITVPENKAAEKGLRVAIYTTSSPGEPASMFEKTLAACANITYPHTTYLLDDTQDPEFKEIAERNGAVWLELVGFPGAKAGKINEALKKTTEDFILVLDPDHIPFPNFFDEVLGYFKDENVGFVQVAQAYYNQYRSFTARAAAEQTYSFYGPTLIGMHGNNCAVVIGANCTFRRKALDSIGGHGYGLTEDLISSIRMHAKGWKSVYAPVIVSRGLVPEDLGSFCKQQLKWARGMHEVLFAELPRLWRKLSLRQKLSYGMTGTYYISGFNTLIYLIIPFLFLFFGWLPANMDFVDFLVPWLPIPIISTLIYLYVQQWLCHPEKERGLHWRGMLLKFACWPVFFYGFLLSIWNGKIPYIPTSKRAVKGLTRFARPLFIHQLLFIALIVYEIINRGFYTPQAGITLTSGEIWGMVAFSLIAFLMTFGGVYAAFQSGNLAPQDPWKEVDLEKIKTR